MKMYHPGFISWVESKVDLVGKKVLEVGSGRGECLRFLAEKYPSSEFTGIDSKRLEIDNLPNCRFEKQDATHLSLESNTYDIVISVATLEHIPDLDAVFREVKRVLKPKGKFLADFAPIWTSVVGHHNSKYAEIVAPWAQLYMSKEEYAKHLSGIIGEEESAKQAEFVFERKDLNRYSRKDYYRVIVESGMIVKEITEALRFCRPNHGLESELNQELMKKISERYDVNDIGVCGMSIYLEKYEQIDF